MQLEVGQLVEGKITGITNFGVFVEFGEGKTGMVHISEVAQTYVSDIRQHVKEGDTVKMKILTIADNGKISLSIKQAENHLDKDEVVEHISDIPTEYISEESASTSLASLLANLK